MTDLIIIKNMTYQKLKTNIEKELLMVLIMGLRHDNISKARAKIISSVLLKVIKGSTSSDDVLDKFSKLCQVYPEMVDPYIKVAKKYEEEDKSERLSNLRINLTSNQLVERGVN